MTLDQIVAISQAVAAVGVILSLVFLAVQLRQNTMAVRSSSIQNLVQSLSATAQVNVDNEYLVPIMLKARTDPKGLTEEERARLHFWFIMSIRRFEGAYFQRKLGLADSAFIDQPRETMRLMRNPVIHGKKEKPYTLSGDLIDLFSTNKKLHRVLSQSNAKAVSDSMTLTSDTLDLRVVNDVLEHAYAWGRKTRAHVVSPSQNMLADSLDVSMPGQRVQRVRATEGQGRIHTSTATVAVLPEAEEVDFELKPEHLRIELCRAGGPGAQAANTTDSAVQVMHIPTGRIVRCQDGRSQQKNKEKALSILRARLLEDRKREEEAKYSATRKSQIGSGGREEKIRTYNFPQNRITDHRIGLTLYNLDRVMEGDLDEMISALQHADLEQRLKDSALA